MNKLEEELLLKVIRERFPIGCRVVDKYGDKDIIESHDDIFVTSGSVFYNSRSVNLLLYRTEGVKAGYATIISYSHYTGTFPQYPADIKESFLTLFPFL